MTREEFESIFLDQYTTLCGYAERRCPTLGTDIVHQAYTHIISNSTYKSGKLKYAKQWIHFKVLREISRQRRKDYQQSQVIHELRVHDIYEDTSE